MRLTYLLFALASGLPLSCARQNMSQELQKPMIYFVNGTDTEISVQAATKHSNKFSGHAIEGGWIDIPVADVNLSQPIVVLGESERVISTHKFNRAPRSDTTIIVGDPNFLKHLIVYIDRKGDTLKNHVDYFFDTNQHLVTYQKTTDFAGNVLSEGLLVPDYIYRNEGPHPQPELVPVGVWLLYSSGQLKRSTIPFRGLEKLPVVFKQR